MMMAKLIECTNFRLELMSKRREVLVQLFLYCSLESTSNGYPRLFLDFCLIEAAYILLDSKKGTVIKYIFSNFVK
jgi:hypothetical protein